MPNPASDSDDRPRKRGLIPELVLAQAILVSFLALSTLQVVSRYVFNAPFVWTEELCAGLLIWMTFLGAAGVARMDGHVRVELLEEFFGRRVADGFYLVYDVVILIFLVAMVIAGWDLMSQLDFERTPALRIPISYVISIVPIASAVMAVYHVIHIFRRVRALRGDRIHAD